MLDSQATIWERPGEVIISPPEPVRPFIDGIKRACRSARFSGSGWIIAAAEAAQATQLLYTFFPVVHDRRNHTPPAPRFDDGVANDAFAALDLVPMLTAVAPLLQARAHERDADWSPFVRIARQFPHVPHAFGYVEGLEGRWVGTYVAQCFLQQLRAGFGSIVSGAVQPDGALSERVTAPALHQHWLHIRQAVCGDVPERLGHGWYPPQSTLPLWIAMLLACVGEPSFMRDGVSDTLTRTLAFWPLRTATPLHRLDLKDAAHWPVSVCVLPKKHRRDGSDVVLHLSSVGGVSKNRALWAAFFDGKRNQLPLRAGGTRYTTQRVEGRGQYVTHWNDEPLTTSGLSHVALTHRTAFEPEVGQSFLHLAGNDLSGAPDLALFAQQLSRALSVPFDLAWVEQLWHHGVCVEGDETPLITPLPSSGCQGYWVLADEVRWMRLIIALQRGVDPVQLSDADLTISEVGAATRIEEVVEHAGEGDDGDGEEAE